MYTLVVGKSFSPFKKLIGLALLNVIMALFLRWGCSVRAARSTSRCSSRWSAGWLSALLSRPSTSALSSGE